MRLPRQHTRAYRTQSCSVHSGKYPFMGQRYNEGLCQHSLFWMDYCPWCHWVLTAPQHCTWPANFSWKFLPYQFWSDWKSHKKVWNSVSWHIGSGLWEAGVPKLHQCFVSSSLPERAFGITDSMAWIKSALNCSHLHLSHNSLIRSRHRVLPDLSSSLSIRSEVLERH